MRDWLGQLESAGADPFVREYGTKVYRLYVQIVCIQGVLRMLRYQVLPETLCAILQPQRY